MYYTYYINATSFHILLLLWYNNINYLCTMYVSYWLMVRYTIKKSILLCNKLTTVGYAVPHQ